MKIINKVIDWIEDQLLWVLMVAMTIIVFLQVILRVTGGTLSWTEETARYIYLWVIYLGCCRGVRMNSEISVDVIRNLLKDESRAQAVYDLIRVVLCAVFAAVFVRYSIAMIERLVQRPKYSPACHYNMIIVYMSSVTGSILMLFRYLQNIFKGIALVINPQKSFGNTGGEGE